METYLASRTRRLLRDPNVHARKQPTDCSAFIQIVFNTLREHIAQNCFEAKKKLENRGSRGVLSKMPKGKCFLNNYVQSHVCECICVSVCVPYSLAKCQLRLKRNIFTRLLFITDRTRRNKKLRNPTHGFTCISICK